VIGQKRGISHGAKEIDAFKSGMEVKVAKSCGMWVGLKRDEKILLKLTFTEGTTAVNHEQDTRYGTWVSYSNRMETARIWSRG